ncbi:hypothetical protein BSKO_13939 [Bryopsis sp. KO-2023]|nr:hypothetical protein BSKO_13939 [Bryopsis sp. KO-2023]
MLHLKLLCFVVRIVSCRQGFRRCSGRLSTAGRPLLDSPTPTSSSLAKILGASLEPKNFCASISKKLIKPPLKRFNRMRLIIFCCTEKKRRMDVTLFCSILGIERILLGGEQAKKSVASFGGRGAKQKGEFTIKSWEGVLHKVVVCFSEKGKRK